MEPFLAIASTLATLVAALAAIASWRAAVKSNATASLLAKIEMERRHAELTPQYQLEATQFSNGQVLMKVKLDGPVALDRVDRIVISVRDEPGDRTSDPLLTTEPGTLGPVWAPYRFTPRLAGATSDGRNVEFSGALLLGASASFQLERTRPPVRDGLSEASWVNEFSGLPVRLSVRSEHDSHIVWTAPYEVFVRSWSQLQ